MKGIKLTDLINNRLDDLKQNSVKGGTSSGCSGGKSCKGNASASVTNGLAALKVENPEPVEFEPIPGLPLKPIVIGTDTIKNDTTTVKRP